MMADKSTFDNALKTDGPDILRNHWSADLLSGFLIFLIALPLSLGIAMACGLPPFAGILTTIIGGVVISFFQGSFITIKGPAAGLIIIVSQCVSELGQGDIVLGYKLTLAVIVVSGIVQMLLGMIRTGVLGDFFPSPAVHGMLAAIGITIILKQVHTVFGNPQSFSGPIESILSIPSGIARLNPEIFIIGLLCLLLLFLLPRIKNKYVAKIPAPMLVVVVSIPLGHFFDLEHAHKYLFLDGHQYDIGPSFLVSLPSRFLEGITFPVFDHVFTLSSLKYVVMFALVGSLESLVSAKAVDNLDLYRRRSDLNKDIFAIGLGNTLCGFLGGLPMISEIVRSSSNVFNGAKTKWSNFFHGAFTMIFVTLAPGLIHQIPLVALSTLLIYVGFKLASPKVFEEIYRVGKAQFMIFLITILVTLFSDILIGMAAGIFVNLLVHTYAGVSLPALFKRFVSVQKNERERTYTLKVREAAVFSNYLEFKSHLDKIPAGHKIIIDFSDARVVDHTVMEHLHYYATDYQRAGGMVSLVGLEALTPWSGHPLSYRVGVEKVRMNAGKYNTREKQLKSLSKAISFTFQPVMAAPQSSFGKFEPQGIRIKYEGNVLIGTINHLRFKISDLSILNVGEIKAPMYQLTALHISGFTHAMPLFSLSREGLLDKIIDKAFVSDIDFEQFPVFSNKYLLKGNNEKEIRTFFTNDIIHFLENQDFYHVNSYGDEFIIYRNKIIASVEEIKNMLKFGENFVSKISALAEVNA